MAELRYRERVAREAERLEHKIRTHAPTPARLGELERLRAIVRNEGTSRPRGSTRVTKSPAKRAAAPPPKGEGVTKLGGHTCRHCGKPLRFGVQQARRRYCDDVCKMRGYRRRRQGLPESIGEHQGSALDWWKP